MIRDPKLCRIIEIDQGSQAGRARGGGLHTQRFEVFNTILNKRVVNGDINNLLQVQGI